MKLTSKAFQNNQKIPPLYTCQGKNINPPLDISEVPKGAQTLCLIMEDPDVPPHVRPDRMFNHWVLYNMSPSISHIAEDSKGFATEGLNTYGRIGYMGPCPPDREHRYFFTLYALDQAVDLKEGATKEDLLKAMKGHILEKCELMGRYEKTK